MTHFRPTQYRRPLKTMMTFVRIFSVVVCSTSPASAALSMKFSGNIVTYSATTSVLKYFGPQDDNLNASAVFLPSNELCDPDTSAVKGKIVIGTLTGPYLLQCNFMTMYRRLNAAGAAGFVKLVQRSPPGLYTTFDHDVWNTAETQGMQMTMVDAFEGDIALSPEITANLSDVHVSVSNYHNTEWYNIYTSTLWLVAMQIIAPLYCLYVVSLTGYIEARAC